MTHKYGIYQSSDISCIFYKQDEDGNQSTFNLFVVPEDEEGKQKTIHSFIDNEQMKTQNWFSTRNLTVEDVMKAFGEWASDAPLVFELNAVKSIGNCLGSKIKNNKKTE